MNAFDPNYVKTYMPNLLKALRVESNQTESGKKNGAKSKAHRESVHGKNVDSISAFPKTKAVRK